MLRRLLELWRETRHPRVAHLVRALSEAAPALDLHGTADWNAAIAQDDPMLLPSLIEHVTSGYATVARARLLQIAGREDPRLIDAIVRWAREMPYRTPPRADEWWAEVRRVLARQAPPELSVEALAEDILLRHSTGYAVKLAGSFRRLKIVGFARRPFTSSEEAFLAALEEEHPPPGPSPAGHASIADLLESVARDPSDDAVRLVLADVLQQEGDPRGELIALQFARLEGRGDPKREAALLRDHLQEWAGPWPAVLGTVTFEKGFLHGLTLDRKLDRLGKLKGDPNVRTLRKLRVRLHKLDDPAERALPRVLDDLPHLDDLGVVRVAHLDGAPALRSRLRRLQIEVVPQERSRVAEAVAALGRLEHLTLVPGYGVTGEMLAEVVAALDVPHVSVRHHWDGGLAALLEVVRPGVRSFGYGGHYHSRLTLHRGDSGRFERAEVRVRGDELQLDALAELPAGIPFAVVDRFADVNVGNWALLPRLAALGSHFERVEYWGRDGTADPAPEHFEGLPVIEVLHVSLLSDQRDHSALLALLADRPEVRMLEITHSLRITRDADGELTEGELRSQWWEADDRVLTALPHLRTLRWNDEPSAWSRTPDDAEDRYHALCARYGLMPG